MEGVDPTPRATVHLETLEADGRTVAKCYAPLRTLMLDPHQNTAVNGSRQRHKITGSPAPWHSEAGMLVTTIHAGVRRCEAMMRAEQGLPDLYRGGSLRNTYRSLEALPVLASTGLALDSTHATADALARWAGHSLSLVQPLPLARVPEPCPMCQTPGSRRRTGTHIVCLACRTTTKETP